MAQHGTASSSDPQGDDDVLARLRSATHDEHERVERLLDLMDPALTRERLAGVLDRMRGFWVSAERGLDDWAHRFPGAAAELDWPRRRRAALFAADLTALTSPDGDPHSSVVPVLPELRDTDDALGRLYVLEGSTLGGVFIDRHLAAHPEVSGGASLAAFSPYGPDTGAMWRSFRTITRAHAAAGGNADRIVRSAQATFVALADWCAAASRPVGGQARR